VPLREPPTDVEVARLLAAALDGLHGKSVDSSQMSQKAATIETLPDDLRETVEEDVRAGEFTDADDAIRKAILSQHERIALRRSLIEAAAQIERGECFTPEQSRTRTRELAHKYRK